MRYENEAPFVTKSVGYQINRSGGVRFFDFASTGSGRLLGQPVPDRQAAQGPLLAKICRYPPVSLRLRSAWKFC